MNGFILCIAVRADVEMAQPGPSYGSVTFEGKRKVTTDISANGAMTLPGTNNSEYVVHAPIVSWMLTVPCCLVAGLRKLVLYSVFG